MAFGGMGEKFIEANRAEAMSSSEDDEEWAEPRKAVIGVETPLRAITTRRIEEYRTGRLSTKSRRGSTLSPATVNRECALLRSILRMAYRWDEIPKVPAFTMAKETARAR